MQTTRAVPIHRRLVLAGMGATLGAALGAFAPGSPRAAVVGSVLVGKNGWLFPLFDNIRQFDPRRLREGTQMLNEAVAVLKAAGIETALAVTPAKSRVYAEYLPDDYRFTPDTQRRYAQGVELLRQPGTLVPDLAEVLENLHRTSPDTPLFFKADTHWTPAGAEAAATEVARQAAARFQLPPSPHPGTEFGPFINTVRHRVDLAELLPPEERARFPTETYGLRQVRGAQGQATLVDDDTADVAVVGNSYAHPLHGFAAMLSNQLERPITLEWKIYQFGPHRTLLSYLGSEAFRRQRPRLIVWVLHEKDMSTTFDDTATWGQNAMKLPAFLTELRRAVEA